MRTILPAVLLLSMGCAAPVQQHPQTSAAAERESVVTGKTLAVRDGSFELHEQPVAITIPVGESMAALREVARDPERALMLRVENISVSAAPNVLYEVFVGDSKQPAGVLALYGAEESNGRHVASLAVDEAAAAALRDDTTRELRITFRPNAGTDAQGRPVPVDTETRVKFSRVRLVAE